MTTCQDVKNNNRWLGMAKKKNNKLFVNMIVRIFTADKEALTKYITEIIKKYGVQNSLNILQDIYKDK